MPLTFYFLSIPIVCIPYHQVVSLPPSFLRFPSSWCLGLYHLILAIMDIFLQNFCAIPQIIYCVQLGEAHKILTSVSNLKECLKFNILWTYYKSTDE